MSVKDTGLDRVINEFTESHNLLALLEAFLNRLDDSESILVDLRDKRSIDNATGVWLDIVGDIVGLNRPLASVSVDSLLKIEDAGISDATMEDKGTFQYESKAGATLTKDSSIKYADAQSLKVVNTDGIFFSGARTKLKYLPESVLVRVSGYAYNVSGSSPAVIYYKNNQVLWTAPSNTATWNAFNVTLTSENAQNIILGVSGAVSSAIVYYDSLVIEEDDSPSRSLLTDGDMEDTDTDHWTAVNGTVLSKVTPGNDGTYALSVVGSGINWQGAQQDLQPSSEDEYGYIEAYVRFLGGGSVPEIWQNTASAQGSVFNTRIANGTTSGVFHKISATFDLNDGNFIIFGGAATNVNVEYDSIYTRFWKTGIKDADMEKATLDDWTAVGGATVAKSGGSHTGTRSLQVINASFTDGAGAQQTLNTNRQSFKIKGWYYHIITTSLAAVYQNGTLVFTGDPTKLSQWVQFEIELKTEDGLDIILGAMSTSAHLVRFDDFFIIEDYKNGFATLSWLADYDMEKTGTAAFTSVGSATLAKSNTVAYSGTQSLKITNTGSAIGAGARQVMAVPKHYSVKYLINGATYHFAAPSLSIFANGIRKWKSSAETGSWNVFNFVYDPHPVNSQNLEFGHTETTINGIMYVDDIIVQPVVSLLFDGQMEELTTAAWTDTGGATLLKTTVTAEVRSDGRSLKVTNTTGTLNASAKQTIDIPGAEKFYVRGFIKNETTSEIGGVYQNGILRWTSANDTVWNYFDLELDAASGLEIGFGHTNTSTGDIFVDEIVCFVYSDLAGGIYNSYEGLLSDEPAEDEEYRQLIKGKASIYSKGSTVVDVYNYILETFGYTSIIDNSVAGRITITTSVPLVGSQRNAMLYQSPVSAGIEIILAN